MFGRMTRIRETALRLALEATRDGCLSDEMNIVEGADAIAAFLTRGTIPKTRLRLAPVQPAKNGAK